MARLVAPSLTAGVWSSPKAVPVLSLPAFGLPLSLVLFTSFLLAESLLLATTPLAIHLSLPLLLQTSLGVFFVLGFCLGALTLALHFFPAWFGLTYP